MAEFTPTIRDLFMLLKTKYHGRNVKTTGRIKATRIVSEDRCFLAYASGYYG
jgi:hypothetical protein